MAIPRGTLETAILRLREGIEQELGLSVIINEDLAGKVSRTQVSIAYDTALVELLKTLLDDLFEADTNTTWRNRLAIARGRLNL